MLVQILGVDSGTADTPNTNLLLFFLSLVAGLAEKGIIPLFAKLFSFAGEWEGGRVCDPQALRGQ